MGSSQLVALTDGRVAELDERRPAKAVRKMPSTAKSVSAIQRLGPGQKLDLLGVQSVVLIGPEVIRALITGTCVCRMSQ